MKTRSDKVSLALSLGMHLLLAGLLFLSFEKTIYVPEAPAEPQEIIEATVVTDKALRQEISRLENKEAEKKAAEEARLEAIANKERLAKEKREKEEQLVLELQQKNEQLKIEAEQKRIAMEKEEKEREKKRKLEEEELAKVQKEKEALKKKAEQEKKVEQEKKAKELADKKKADEQAKQANAQKKSDETGQNQNIVKLNHDEITRHAQLIRSRVNQNWRQPLGLDIKGLTCKISVKLLPTGEVVDAHVIESSGSLELDRSAELAVHKSSPLPMPNNEDVAKVFRQFTFTFRPEAA